MDIIDIDLNNVVPKKPHSVNFGSGIELLMNDNKRSGSHKIDLGELDNLENELNQLSDTNSVNDGSKQLNGLSGFSNMFNFSSPKQPAQDRIVSENAGPGEATKDLDATNTSTWDGFQKVTGDIPQPRVSSHMTEREKRRKKRMMIKKLEEWAEKGSFKSINQFDMNSNYDEIEDEYEGALEDKRKRDSVKLQGWWFTTIINTFEYGNALLNPFDLNLDGWGEQVSEDLDSYEDLFAELHEKYKGGKMAPEISLLLRIGFSAAVVNMSNKMLSSSTPGFGDVVKQSPELMKMFSNAAVNVMSQENSAFDFAKTMMQNPQEQVNTTYGPPPASIKTKNQEQPPRPNAMQYTQAPNNRPDIRLATNQPQRQHTPITEDIPTRRPEMRGPPTTDIDELLNGLKKTNPVSHYNMQKGDDDSVISISSLKDLNNTQMPKKVAQKRRNNSDKNMVSLDI
jgi:hypothetical protein